MSTFLQRFLNIRKDELPATLASAAFFFCVLTALMVLRPAREALGMQRGLDAVRWLFIGTAVVTLAVNPVFGLLVSRMRRLAFITATYGFFAVSLLIFWGLLTLAPQAIGEVSGMVFYVWFSVFNFFSTMVFWALMADRFTLEQSKRFFGVVAVGGTLGAIFGPWLAQLLAEPFGTANLLLVAVTFLLLAVGMAWLVTRLQPAAITGDPAAEVPAVIGGSAWAGFRSALTSPYLLAISAYVLILAVVVTFIYFTRLAMVAEIGSDLDTQTTIFAQIDIATQVATLVLQLIVTGHLMRRLGVPVTLALAADRGGAGLCRVDGGRDADRAGALRRRLPRGAARDHAAGARDALHRGEHGGQVQGEGVHRHLRVPRRRRDRGVDRGAAGPARHGTRRPHGGGDPAGRGLDGARHLAGT